MDKEVGREGGRMRNKEMTIDCRRKITGEEKKVT